MEISSITLAIIGFVLLNLAMVHYFAKVKQSKTPRAPLLLIVGMVVSSLLSLVALANHTFTADLASITIALLAFNNLSTSALFSYFLATRKTPLGDIRVKVGDQLLPFANEQFDTGELAGKRTLIKFYRGSWCPYCSSELSMFEALTPKLAAHNIDIVAISNDSKVETTAHAKRDNLSFKLIADPALAIIRQYGVEHHKGLGATADDTLNVFGIAMPLPWKMRFKAMAIPTSLLVDENGKIVWIDQSDDYRIRASEERVMAAVTNSFSD
ncbi:peroxiredoxin family protein [Thalassotalea euphylliae]|uniref:Thioredoxin domain-containing protein n=1 Tax=Thalassotalea euphylliae TaxID=1655234 RepID=A0A3E0U8Z1_9GAMM|nr:peroxiredoxin family protein [Thalassotalea euphylliae]REL32535.1 hypothetical protein DXX94_18465 [Thalassotalea euphylliae]